MEGENEPPSFVYHHSGYWCTVKGNSCSTNDRIGPQNRFQRRIVEESPRRGLASGSTYLNLDLVHIGRLEKLERVVQRKNVGVFTKLLTMILESPLPAAGPLGAVALVACLVPFAVFEIPPAGAALVTLVAFGTRRPRPRRPAGLRWLTIVSRSRSNLEDIL